MTRSLAFLAALMALSACHTDPFSVKPEVRGVTIPDKDPPAQEADDDAGDEKDAPKP